MTASNPVSLRIPADVRAALTETARRSGRDFSSVANEMLGEAVRMRRIPGITFADGPAGRRARIAGTGIDVFEVARAYDALGRDRAQLAGAYHWLTDQQLRAALAYAEAYPEEIESRLQREDEQTPEAVWTAYPFTRPDAP